MEKEIDGVKAIFPEEMSEEEVQEYINRGLEHYREHLHGIEIQLDEDDKDFVKVWYDVGRVPFHRLRRITGYLVGTLDRWNNAKRAEEHDRVKHG